MSKSEGDNPTSAWPNDVNLVISALEVAQYTGGPERRQAARMRYRARAKLRLSSDPASSDAIELFTRDVDPRSLGFVIAQHLPPGHSGSIELPTPDGGAISVPCTLLRCRQAAPGWFEGALRFDREQDLLS